MKKTEFWVTNISNMNVGLSDLNLTIKAFSSVNLLDPKHHYCTKEQIDKSATSGSLFKKRDKILIRMSSPEIVKQSMTFDQNASLPSKERSTHKIIEEHYEELNLSDEQFADENAELAEIDNKPLISKG